MQEVIVIDKQFGFKIIRHCYSEKKEAEKYIYNFNRKYNIEHKLAFLGRII